MGTWSEEFNNIPRAASDARRSIREFILERIAPHPTDRRPVGEIFYFPPGEHVLSLGRGEVFDIPEHVEFRFAPGARLIVVGEGARLVIRGTLAAPIAPIFATAATVNTSSLPGPLALVIPFGPRIERIHPEWWGAGALKGRSPGELDSAEINAIAAADSEALQRAFHAAIFGEALASTPGAVSTRVPVVELLGTYIVNRPIYLGGSSAIDLSPQATPTGLPSPLEVRGRFSDPERVTLWCAPTFDVSAHASMLAVVDLPQLFVRCVSFESSKGEISCVGAFAIITSASGSTRLPYVFQHCRFRSRGEQERRRVALVRLDVLGASMEAAAPAAEFEGCVFEPSRTLGAAVRLNSLDRVSGAAFRGCTFAGHAMAMIDAIGFSVATTGCRFQNEAIPPRISMASHRLSDKEFASMHEVAPEGGVDIYLRQNPLDVDPASTAVLPWSSVPANASPDMMSTCAFSSQDCRSTSPQFLVAPWPLGVGRLMRPSTIIGLHHHFEFDPPTVRPPAISWNASRNQRPVALHLVGCRFDGVDPNSAPRVASPQTPWPGIFDYGIIAGDGPTVTLTDDDAGRTSGPGLVQLGLVVGCAPNEGRRTT